MSKEKISPLKQSPLRHPGQSCDEEIDKIIEKAIPLVMIVTTLGLVSFYLWGIYFFNFSILKMASIISLIAFASGIFAFIRILRLKKQADNYRLGRDGEKVVAQYLEQVPGKHARIFHDVIKDNKNRVSNIDHIIVSIRGIFIIDTKTLSQKPNDNKIIFDGESIFVNNFNTQDKYINQINSSISWLRKKLKDITGKEYPIKGAVIFPGWYVEMNSKAKKSNIWALNPENLIKFLKNEPKRMEMEDVMYISNMIETYIRNN